MSSRRALVADIVESSVVDGPGNRFVVFLQGCNFDCLACHNPHTISRLEHDGCRWMDVAELVERIRVAEPFISGVTVSGGEATVQWRFVADLFAALAADPQLAQLSRLVDTNGDAGSAAWDALVPVMHGAMVDLKAFHPDVHVFLTGRRNDRVLRSIEHLASVGGLHEVRLLLVPGVNDRPSDLAAAARWLLRIDPTMRVRVMGFRRAGTRAVAESFREAEPEDLDRAVGHLVAAGIHPGQISIPMTPVSAAVVAGPTHPVARPPGRPEEDP